MDFIQKNKEAFPRDACVFLWLHKANEAKFTMEIDCPRQMGPSSSTPTWSPHVPLNFSKHVPQRILSPFARSPRKTMGSNSHSP